MARLLEYHHLFDCDVREAAAWYEQRSPHLGDDFVQKTQACVSLVSQSPQRFAKLPSGCSYAKLERFPYVLLFRFDDEKVILLGVTHTARDPSKWRTSLGGEAGQDPQ